MENNKITKAFEKWKERSDKNYIKAICKPCWELKYCPYGVLVENFNLCDDISNPYRCRIFGHICPVFKVAEPLTETKEMRNITRVIPRSTQFKVLRRDGYICQNCKQHIDDEHINFDHIIPWSKGGPSEESNLRLLCEKCNKKRGNNFESQYLVSHVQEIINDPHSINIEMLKDLLRLFYIAILINQNNGHFNKDCFLKIIETKDKETDLFLFNIISQIWALFNDEKFFIQVRKKEQILRYRWGLSDLTIHSIDETCKKFNVDYSYYVDLEQQLLRQIGFILIIADNETKLYSEECIDNEGLEKIILKLIDKLKN